MAIDTAAKRHSAIFVGSPWRIGVPLPDGTVGQGDRQALAFLYSGIAAIAGAIVTNLVERTARVGAIATRTGRIGAIATRTGRI